jgi:hypothetical protein
MLTADDGEVIARKLRADFKKKNRRHKIAVVKVNGREVGRYGIRRGSGDLNHNYIAPQLRMSMRDAEEIAGCTKNLLDYEAVLRANGFYPN